MPIGASSALFIDSHDDFSLLGIGLSTPESNQQHACLHWALACPRSNQINKPHVYMTAFCSQMAFVVSEAWAQISFTPNLKQQFCKGTKVMPEKHDQPLPACLAFGRVFSAPVCQHQKCHVLSATPLSCSRLLARYYIKYVFVPAFVI